MTTALIIGVTGQDGSYLAEHLVAQGQRVVGTSRVAARNAEHAGIERRVLEPSDPTLVSALVREIAPDRVFHLAAQSSVGTSFVEPAATFTSIATTTLHVLEAVRLAAPRARVFIASSGEVFGDTGKAAADEQTRFQPLSPYAAAKAAATELARAYRASYGLFVSVGFLYNHESTRRPQRFVTRKIARAACEIKLGRRDHVELGDLSVVRDWGWAPEYVDAMARMLERDAPDDFVVATGRSEPLEHFVRLAFAEVGLDWKKYVRTQPALFRPAEARVLRANPERAARELGWRATLTVDDVARRLVEHERTALVAEAAPAEAP